MSTQLTGLRAAGMRHQLGEFLTRHMSNRAVGWPRRAPQLRGTPTVRAGGGSATGLRVLVIGDLSLELPTEVPATRAQLLASLRAEPQGRNLRGTHSEPDVGGFVARASRVAAALGARVSVCATVPVPIPARFERFLDECSVDRRYVTGLPVPCPVTILFRCQDGGVVGHHHRSPPVTDASLPVDVAREFDVILIDPRCLNDVGATVRSTSRCLGRSPNRLKVGLRLDRRSGCNAVSLASDDRVWTFVRQRDAGDLAGRTGAPVAGDADALVRWLHDRQGIARLVLLRGPHGAVLMNGIPCPYHVQTCPLGAGNGPGAGDTLVAVTTLSSAAGADDRTSIRRGVAAATGQVAGLPLPTSLEELDAA